MNADGSGPEPKRVRPRWMTELARSIDSADALGRAITLTPEELEGARRAEHQGLPIRVTPHYLSLVGDEVAAVIYSTGLPLVVAATGEVIGHFEATTKVHVDARVEGSPAEWTVAELRDHAHEAIKAELKPDHNQFSERFGTALAHAHASDDLEEVLAAANNGRVDALMVCHHDEHCGKTNQAVIDTLRNGGEVSQCSPDAMPGGAFIAAIYRY